MSYWYKVGMAWLLNLLKSFKHPFYVPPSGGGKIQGSAE
jgi:hypothetical protein